MTHGNANVKVVFVSDGSASHPRHPCLSTKDLAAIRRNEAVTSMNILGVPSQNLFFLDAKDGTLDRLDEEEAARVIERISLLLFADKPTAIFLPCRDDVSSEHEAVFTLVQRAIEKSEVQVRLLEYPVWAWWNPLRILYLSVTVSRVWRVDLEGAYPLKQRAVASYVSQTMPIPPETSSALPYGFSSFFESLDEFFFER
jgi:LmbE family N-acetylglucosaminyl deacetylase